jgi:hypothetical protein
VLARLRRTELFCNPADSERGGAFGQEVHAPDFFVQIDRARALQFGITVNDIGNNVTASLSSSEQVSPNFWTDPTNGIPYYIAVQTPQYQLSVQTCVLGMAEGTDYEA